MGFSVGDLLKEIGQGAIAVGAGMSVPGAIGAGLGSMAYRQLTGGKAGTQPALPHGGSSLGAAEILVPDFIERGIGTMPTESSNGTATGAGCSSIATVKPARVVPRMKADPGYVIVECPKGSGRKVQMRKSVARAEGYWKPRRKPPISVKDWRALMRADSTVKKIKNVSKRAGMVQRARGKR